MPLETVHRRLLWGALLAITSYQATQGARQTSTNGWRSLSEVCFCHRVFAEVSLVLYTMLLCFFVV